MTLADGVVVEHHTANDGSEWITVETENGRADLCPIENFVLFDVFVQLMREKE